MDRWLHFCRRCLAVQYFNDYLLRNLCGCKQFCLSLTTFSLHIIIIVIIIHIFSTFNNGQASKAQRLKWIRFWRWKVEPERKVGLNSDLPPRIWKYTYFQWIWTNLDQVLKVYDAKNFDETKPGGLLVANLNGKECLFEAGKCHSAFLGSITRK